ncbi:glycerol-3-phosphate dehydrogenase [Sphingomonas sp. MM-1]|uniref:glycerol-3-phosphate dehydrogenase n=1 Tax=Sphingomonas sp. MM-1 TaxID=745310 RepID=UPI0005A41B2D|nr:glycerol-3-phosphate dehydrogenase [Sphingomonas sp. MM-1]
MTMRFDLLIVGGGINGVGIARDATGRGVKTLLVEQDDLAAHTSSASTKLIHGGLRYLEYLEFRLVRESLIEREKLLRIAPHIIHPLRFVMPMGESGRPGWMVRLGLFLYDHLGGRGILPGSAAVRLAGDGLAGDGLGAGLKPGVTRGFAYSDCRVDDARLTVLNAMDAAARGADIRTRTRFIGAKRDGDAWAVSIEDGPSGRRSEVRAANIVNAAGPWVGGVLGAIEGARAERPPRLVKGSHIVVPRLFAGDHAFILQNPDGRIMFAIPYERDFTLIGTTDVAVSGDPAAARIEAEEVAYLCEGVNRWFAKGIGPADVIWRYSGVRPLYDDGSASASAVTRDYVLKLGMAEGPQLLSVFGGKLTTYRRLAEHALEKLAPFLPMRRGAWTDGEALPGGDLPDGDFAAFVAEARRRWPFLPPETAERMAGAYGTRMAMILGDARSLDDLGEAFGGGLSESELAYLIDHEFARTAEDIAWRRSKLGLRMTEGDIARIAGRLAQGKMEAARG